MLNQVILVGRLIAIPMAELDQFRNTRVSITVAIQRPFESSKKGVYETDFIKCFLLDGLSKDIEALGYFTKGATVGIKARLVEAHYMIDGKTALSYSEVVVEKITFISKGGE